MQTLSGTSCVAFLFIVLSSAFCVAQSEDFLVGPNPEDLAAMDEAFAEAMDTATACGGGVAADRLLEIDAALKPIWEVVPKNRHGRVEWRLLRYVVHRFFMQQSSIVVRGFEPAHRLNSSSGAVVRNAGILSKLGDARAVGVAFDTKQLSVGFSFDDALAMVVAVEQIMGERDVKLLEATYKLLRKPTNGLLGHEQFSDLIEAHVFNWIVDGEMNPEEAEGMIKDRDAVKETFPRWTDFGSFASGLVQSMRFARERRPSLPGSGRIAMAEKYSFEDAREIAGSIRSSFARFWETECQVIKNALVELDRDGTGRVSLSEFYGSNVDGEWRFGESEAYLRDLGALDESSSKRGKQVIIPNYMQGASNCIVTSKHYLVCCMNECETVLNDIEDTIGSSVGTPEEILELVRNMSNFADERPKMGATLEKQLATIAEHHGGKVPLHGRLFAQWLHYVFPRECPFPHKVGAASWLTPIEFATSIKGDFAVSDTDLEDHASMRTNGSISKKPDDSPWMTQWSAEEELLSDYSRQLRTFWGDGCRALSVVGGLAALLALARFSIIRGDNVVAKGAYFGRRAHFL